MFVQIDLEQNPQKCTWVSMGKYCSFFAKFGVLCFLLTSVLTIAFLRYYRRFNFLIIAPIRALKMKFPLKQYIVNMNCPNILTFNK